MSRSKGRVLDEYLVLAAQAGDRAAFDQLVRRWHRKLVAHAWRLTGTRDAAADVAQSAWFEIVRGLPGLRDETAFPAWAYRIVTRQAAKLVGRLIASRSFADQLQADECTGNEVFDEYRLDGELIHGALSRLSPIHRAAVALHYFEELSIAEIAVALDVPAGTVKTRLMHARMKLRAQFEGEDDDQS